MSSREREGALHVISLVAHYWPGCTMDGSHVPEAVGRALELAQASVDKLWPEGESEQCRWTEDDLHGCWETACGQASVFEDGGPAEHRHRYCPYCGKPIEAVPYVPPKEEDDDQA